LRHPHSDPFGFAENAVQHYSLSGSEADHASERMQTALYNSGLETGGLGGSSYCSYCADQMAKDD
jgi:hypothetical protein